METNYFDLPDLITLPEHGNDPIAFLDAVYEIFKSDFIDSKPVFPGKRVGLKKYPLIDGKEYTFYHLTHDGNIEKERLPNLRRMERIRWPKPIIENTTHSYLKVWKNERDGKDRILIFHEDESYLVVLADRGEYILPWTAYLVDKPHKKRKLLNEYVTYKKANAAR